MFLSTTVFAQIGQVVALKGDVKVERESKIQELLLKDKILKNDQISTLNNSRTQLLLNDETIITIGENSKIGAGSVVLEEVPPNSTVVGVPGRVVKRDNISLPRDDMDQIHLPDPVEDELTQLRLCNEKVTAFMDEAIKEIEQLKQEMKQLKEK